MPSISPHCPQRQHGTPQTPVDKHLARAASTGKASTVQRGDCRQIFCSFFKNFVPLSHAPESVNDAHLKKNRHGRLQSLTWFSRERNQSRKAKGGTSETKRIYDRRFGFVCKSSSGKDTTLECVFAHDCFPRERHKKSLERRYSTINMIHPCSMVLP